MSVVSLIMFVLRTDIAMKWLFHMDVLDASVSLLRWKNWLREIDHITKFLKTGEICSSCQLSETEQKELVEMAQKYYIESELILMSSSNPALMSWLHVK